MESLDAVRAGLRARLLEELTRATGSADYASDMVERIAAGKLVLPACHSERARELAESLANLRPLFEGGEG